MKKTLKNNSIFLSGGGDENQSFILDKHFFSQLPQNGNFLYIPNALRGNALYPTAKFWLSKVLELHGRTDLKFETADNLSKYQNVNLNNFDAIYIGGGNTWHLMYELKDSGFFNLLVDYAESGGLIYGGSAGAIVLGNRIDTHDDENNINYQDMSGLNLLSNLSVACHYREDQSEQFKEWSKHNNLPIICLPEETGLIIENGITACVGTKPGLVYQPNGSEKQFHPKESFKL